MTFPSAIQADAKDDAAEAQRYKTVSDIGYRDGHGITDYMEERCRLDVYYPVDVQGFNHGRMAGPAFELLLRFVKKRLGPDIDNHSNGP